MLIESRPATDPEVAALVTAQQRELGETGAPRDDVRYLAVVIAGRAVACGGLRELAEGVGELSGMYVRPAYRGRGIGRQLLAALEELAFRRGHSVLCVEAGTNLPVAISLYRSGGYAPVPAYREHVGGPNRVCLGKRLPVAA
ncbi:GNAT family N-acetyltransferase [Micromonospora craterilacus]|uniref:GNAT family N-acetyltransferase n=1 Tax=Micromonospora craterilacus TaxID=1655439 RepID=A0A2W2FPI3_9ACTN|nr:GNAT family N-acetyltransferase [Micromonospora craterilacus]PZG16994.1 GNAT family N-acetyltransferase [Micromonospora craterilacus]